MVKKQKVGRPPKYATPEKLQEKINLYFDKDVPRKTYTDSNGNSFNVPIPTISGLALYCGFADRHTFYEYEKKPEFSYTIKKARARMAQHYEELIQSNNPTGAIFALKNFGWSDKLEIDHTLKEYLHEDLSDKTPEELEKMADDLKKRRTIAGSKNREGAGLQKED